MEAINALALSLAAWLVGRSVTPGRVDDNSDAALATAYEHVCVALMCVLEDEQEFLRAMGTILTTCGG